MRSPIALLHRDERSVLQLACEVPMRLLPAQNNYLFVIARQ